MSIDTLLSLEATFNGVYTQALYGLYPYRYRDVHLYSRGALTLTPAMYGRSHLGRGGAWGGTLKRFLQRYQHVAMRGQGMSPWQELRIELSWKEPR